MLGQCETAVEPCHGERLRLQLGGTEKVALNARELLHPVPVVFLHFPSFLVKKCENPLFFFEKIEK